MKKETLVKAAVFGLYVSTLTSCKRPTFTIRFLDENGDVLQKDNLSLGELPVFKKEIPTKDNCFFSLWEPKINRVEKDQDYIACYKNKSIINTNINKDILNILYKDIYLLGSHSVTNYIDDFHIDFRWFVNYSNYEYSDDIAKVAVICNILKGNFKDGIDSSNKIDFLKNRLLCDNIVEIDLKPEQYESDKNDITGGFMAHHEINYFNQKYDFIIMSLRGTRNSNEWASNFDLGYDDESYYSKTDKHPEWKDKDFHKGFYVASNRWLRNVKERDDTNGLFKINAIEYVKKYSKNKNTILLITGHSRGAAIASIVGEYFENQFIKDNPSFNEPKVFTYTFASPNTISVDKSIISKTIFNIINKDDVVPMTPLNQWGFKRLGTDIIVRSILSDLSTQFKDKIGEEYQYLKGAQGIFQNVKGRRSEFYNVKISNETNLAKEFCFKNENDAKKRLEEIKNIITDSLKLPLNYFEFVINNENKDCCILKIYNCKATLLKVLENILTSKYSILNLFSVIKNLNFVLDSNYIKFINDLLFETSLINGLSLNLNAFVHPHDITAYILLVDNNKK